MTSAPPAPRGAAPAPATVAPTGSSAGAAPVGSAALFVQVDRSNARFTLGGKPFYFLGSNAYYLEQETAYGSTVATDALDAFQAAGIKVVRTWGFNNNGTGTASNDPSVIQESAGVYQDSGWQAMDTVIAEAGKRGIKLIVNLVNNWDDYGGMNQYVTWAGLSGHDLFFTNAAVKQLYKNYVTAFLNRTNSVTGVVYKNDPTIFGWELANEARCQSDPGAASGTLVAWYREMSAYVKTVDPNHLVATGEEGFDVTTTGMTPLTSYSLYYHLVAWFFGTSFTQNTALPDIDWASGHLYPDLWGWLMPTSDGASWIQDHTGLAGALGKPFLLGEYGLETSPHAIYQTWLDTVTSSNTAGALLWELVPASRNAQTQEASNVVDPTDASDVAIQTAAATLMNAK
jgi:mannan endo-1,4-beta-mannosidase